MHTSTLARRLVAGAACAVFAACAGLACAAAATGEASGPGVQHESIDAGGRSEPPSAADLLATLPDGEARRRFIIDCTGCHTFHDAIGWPAGQRRTAESWRAAAASMIQRFGPRSGFPVIGERDADATAAWLDGNLPEQPPARRTGLPAAMRGSAEFREYPMPQAGDLPHDVAIDAGRVVITGMFTASMYVLDPATGDIRAEPTPAPNPRAVEVDAKGNWWVVLGGPRLLARRAPDGSWQTWAAGFYAHSVAPTHDGVWLNGHFTHDPELVRRIDPGTGVHRDYAMPAHPDFAVTTVPYEIRAAPDGAVWMSELQGNRILRIEPRTGEVRTWSMPTSWSGPRRFDVDPDGVLWIPAYGANMLVRFDPRTEAWTEYALPLDATAPYVARWDARRRQVWIGTGAADVVFRFDPVSERFRGYTLPSRDQLVRHLAVDTVSGDIWLAPGTVPARVVRLRPVD